MIIKRLNDGDQDIVTNALTLLNVTLNVCEDDNKAKEVIKLWESAGISEILKVLNSY